jgi:hypothetical protein
VFCVCNIQEQLLRNRKTYIFNRAPLYLEEHTDGRKKDNDDDNINIVISLEDENGNEDGKMLSVIPRDDIQKGSALDLGTRIDKNSGTRIDKNSEMRNKETKKGKYSY